MNGILSLNNGKKASLLRETGALLKDNIRNYAMYLALAAIFIFFYFTTDGAFLTARNITNLINQTGYVAVLAVGMTLVLILQQIDLSIGYAAGFFGACAAILLKQGIPLGIVIPIILAGGLLAGLCQGLIIGKIGVPAFVTTLAFQFVFRGLLSLVTEATGTVPVTNETFNQLSNGFVFELFNIGGKHGLSLVIGVVAIVLVIASQINERRDLKHYNFNVVSLPIFVFKVVFFSALIGTLTYVLSGYNGISWTIVIVVLVTFIYHFMLKKTRLGRYIYGVGGNNEAAALAGINVKKTVIFAFASMGLMAALGGMLYTSRLQSAAPTAGAGFELDAIAACYIGGVSTSGGVGKVVNSIIGAFVIMSLTNGLNLMSVGITYQYIIKGAIFVLAVAFDVYSQGRKTI